MKLHYFPTPAQANVMSTDDVREHLHIGGLFQPGQVNAHYTDLDRMVVGAAMPTNAPLALPHAKELCTSFFLERREIGILNIGAQWISSMALFSRIFGYLDLVAEVPEPREPVRIDPATVRGEVAFEQVTFAYEKDGRPALDGIDLLVPAGTSLALARA